MKFYSLLLLGFAKAIHGDGDGDSKMSAGGLIGANGKWIPERYATEDDD